MASKRISHPTEKLQALQHDQHSGKCKSNNDGITTSQNKCNRVDNASVTTDSNTDHVPLQTGGTTTIQNTTPDVESNGNDSGAELNEDETDEVPQDETSDAELGMDSTCSISLLLTLLNQRG